jgi:hypothetical protein
MDHPLALLVTLSAIGLLPYETARAFAQGGAPLAASGQKWSEAEIDAALAKTELTTGDRLTVKIAMSSARLIGKRSTSLRHGSEVILIGGVA